MPDMSAWGPLALLAGEWVGETGVDRAFSHTQGHVLDTPYREICSMHPFGPVDSGSQELYGLDYRTTIWRGTEDHPFHAESGYWLWDAATNQVMKCFVIPRGIAVLAGGTCEPDARSWSMSAALGDTHYSISENLHLANNASSRRYDVTVYVGDDGSWSYDQTTVLRMNEFEGPFSHTDHHVLHRAS